MQMRGGQRIVRHIAKVLRPIVMSYISVVRNLPLGVVDFVFIALLIPAPIHRAHAVPCNFFNILAHVGQIEGRVVVRRRRFFDVAAHEGKRQAGKGQVLRNAPRVS